MDALDDEDVVLPHLQFLAARMAGASGEVVLRQLHLLATEEGIKLLINQFEVEGIEALVVVFAIGILRRMLAVDEIVVERDLQRPYAVG